MPFELIRRKEGEFSEKQEIRHSNVQVSINDWGHLCIREFDESNEQYYCLKYNKLPKDVETSCCTRDICEGCDYFTKKTISGEEHLIVFDKRTTDRILEFVEKLVHRRLPF